MTLTHRLYFIWCFYLYVLQTFAAEDVALPEPIASAETIFPSMISCYVGHESGPPVPDFARKLLPKHWVPSDMEVVQGKIRDGEQTQWEYLFKSDSVNTVVHVRFGYWKCNQVKDEACKNLYYFVKAYVTPDIGHLNHHQKSFEKQAVELDQDVTQQIKKQNRES